MICWKRAWLFHVQTLLWERPYFLCVKYDLMANLQSGDLCKTCKLWMLLCRPGSLLSQNPYTILSQVPADSKWFSVVKLSNAFFSVPVHQESILVCILIWNSALRDSLETLVLPKGSALLQCVDDILVVSETREGCVKDTLALLTHLAEQGQKASLWKLQFVAKEFTFLGHVISS